MLRLNFYFTDLQRELLWLRAEQVGSTASDVLRRLLDQGLREQGMNELYPVYSGCFARGPNHGCVGESR